MSRQRWQLEWSVFAMSDRTAIFDYVEADNPRAAIRLDGRIRAQVGVLSRFPRSGRTGRVKGTRELAVLGTPYIAAYRIAGEKVRILRILHGAQRWPEQLMEEWPQ